MNVEESTLKIVELKKVASEALAQGDVEAFLDASSKEIALLTELRLRLVEKPIVLVENEMASRVLQDVRLGVNEEKRAIAAILSRIEDDGTCGLLVEDSGDIDDLAEQLFFSWFSSRDYVLGLFRTGAIIVRCQVPSELRVFVEEARQCFALSQYNAVLSLCRTIIESAVTDIGVRIKVIPESALTDPNFFKQREYSTWKRVDLVSIEPLRKQIHDLYADASVLIHGRKTVGSATALKSLRDTLQIIEQLYLQHHLLVSDPNSKPHR